MRAKLTALALGATCLATQALAGDVWITLSNDGYETIQKYRPALIQKNETTETLLATSDVKILKVRERDLNMISELMHKTHRRCGGFFTHDDLPEAQQSIISAATLSTQSVAVNYTVNNATVVNELQNAVNEADIKSMINSLTGFTDCGIPKQPPNKTTDINNNSFFISNPFKTTFLSRN